MQKRIEELIKQCTYTTTTYANGIDESVEEFDKEKFAELIIKECAHITWLNSTKHNIAHLKIKEHFGIKG